MQLIWQGLIEAFELVANGDRLVLSAAWRSFWISSLAVCLSAAIGLPLGSMLATVRFKGRSVLIALTRAAMAVPTVFVGLVCYSLFSRRGPMGSFDLLYTPWAIVIGEFLLALPIIVGLSHGAIKSLDPRVGETAQTLGAGLWRRWFTFLSEARVGIVLALMTAFARCVTELGIAMMVGGNIKHQTRTLATATAMETGKGEFERGLAMGIILVAIALGATLLMATLGREKNT